MAKKIKTITFSEDAEKHLSLLMSDLGIHSASECIRYAIDMACVTRGLISKNTLSEYTDNVAKSLKDRGDVISEIEMVSIQMARHNTTIDDIYKMCYEIRDGINSLSNFMDAPFTSADTQANDPAVSKAIQGSRDSYNAKMRLLSVDKANRR